MKIALYNIDTKIILSIIENPRIFSDRIVGDNKEIKNIDWSRCGYVTIPDNYNEADHVTGYIDVTLESGETVSVPQYDSGAYIEGKKIPNADTVVSEFVSVDAVRNNLNDLVEQKIRKKYSFSQELEINRKINAINQGIFVGTATEQSKAEQDFQDYNDYVETCISEAKTELGYHNEVNIN